MLAVAWGGAALFPGSLLYFAYFFLVQLGRPATMRGEPVGRAIGTQRAPVLGLRAASLGVRTTRRQGLAGAAAPARPRPIALRLAGQRALPRRVRHVAAASRNGVAGTGLGRWVLHAAQLGGLVLTLRSAARIDIWELAGVRQARAASSTPSPVARPAASAASAAPAPAASAPASSALEIEGPYRWLRHPIYLGWVLLVFGAPTMTAGRLLFAGISTVY